MVGVQGVARRALPRHPALAPPPHPRPPPQSAKTRPPAPPRPAPAHDAQDGGGKARGEQSCQCWGGWRAAQAPSLTCPSPRSCANQRSLNSVAISSNSAHVKSSDSCSVYRSQSMCGQGHGHQPALSLATNPQALASRHINAVAHLAPRRRGRPTPHAAPPPALAPGRTSASRGRSGRTARCAPPGALPRTFRTPWSQCRAPAPRRPPLPRPSSDAVASLAAATPRQRPRPWGATRAHGQQQERGGPRPAETPRCRQPRPRRWTPQALQPPPLPPLPTPQRPGASRHHCPPAAPPPQL